jgi:cytochrome c oxidase cbb3-type subunit 3
VTIDPIQGEIVQTTGGIPQADNRLPGWWLWLFWSSVALAAGIWLASAAFHVVPGPLERYLAERAAALDTGGLMTDPMLLELSRDRLAVQAGAAAFAKNCTRCHGERGEGNVGPNLTDAFWIGGGSPVDIYATIVEGRNARGMPPWGGQLGRGACKQVAAFLLTIREQNLPGKPPQGARWQPPAPEAGPPR